MHRLRDKLEPLKTSFFVVKLKPLKEGGNKVQASPLGTRTHMQHHDWRLLGSLW